MSAVKASTLNVGDYIRSPKDSRKIYQIQEKRGEASILVWRYDSINKKLLENDFIFIRGENMVEKASI